MNRSNAEWNDNKEWNWSIDEKEECACVEVKEGNGRR